MTTVQPGEKIVLSATFTANGEVAVPQLPVQVAIKPAAGNYGTAENAAGVGDGVYEVTTTAPEAPGLYVAKFTSADGGIATVVFQVSED